MSHSSIKAFYDQSQLTGNKDVVCRMRYILNYFFSYKHIGEHGATGRKSVRAFDSSKQLQSRLNWVDDCLTHTKRQKSRFDSNTGMEDDIDSPIERNSGPLSDDVSDGSVMCTGDQFMSCV